MFFNKNILNKKIPLPQKKEMIDWIVENWVEIFGAIAGLLYIFLSIKEKILLWPIGIITSTVYIYVFFQSKFYADMSLQFYYVFVSIYGWIFWLKGKKNEKDKQLKISKTPFKTIIILVFVTLALFLGMGWFLSNYTDSPVPFWDAFTTAASIVATWMLAKKFIEQWIIWIIVDIISAILYYKKGLYPTVILFGVYTIMAVIGYIEWRKTFVKLRIKNGELRTKN
ncbi:MAG: nicotinamide mononucleotide transporter [Bacteroidales bacterium]|nr:nicotinamide mononucleotide transporter [Bacteroidales bacterium]